MLECLEINPVKRPDAFTVLSKPYFNSINNFIYNIKIPNKISGCFKKSNSDIIDFLIDIVDRFGYTNASYCLTFYLFRSYINCLNIDYELYKKISLVLLMLISVYISEDEVSYLSYLNIKNEIMTDVYFRNLLSICLKNIFTNKLLFTNSFASQINLLSKKGSYILCHLMDNNIFNLSLKKMINISFITDKFVNKNLSDSSTLNKYLYENITDFLSFILFDRYFIKTVGVCFKSNVGSIILNYLEV